MKPIIIYNKYIPFKGFYAMTFLNMIFIRKEYESLDNTLVFNVMKNHESIHIKQEQELGFILFYVLYLIEWLIKLVFYGKNAYYNISFEREAYNNEGDELYINNRKHYCWIKRIFK